MSRNYRHINEYEKEILEMRGQGKSKREICEKYGFTKKQLTDFITRYNRKQKKLAAGIPINPKGRTRKEGAELPASVQQLSKLAQLQYKLAMKERLINRLEMENELMRDFLLLTEGK